MTSIAYAETRMTAASDLLAGRLVLDAHEVSVDTAELDLLAVEQADVARATTELIARMDAPRTSAAQLDRLTEQIAALLARAEDVRATRARVAARRDGDERRWRDYLEPA